MKFLDKLSNSEKRLLKYGSIIVAVTLAWVLVYQPLTKKINQNQQKVQNLQAQYQKMQTSTNLLKRQFNKVNNYARDPNKPFISWIDSQLVKHKLNQYVTRSEPKDNKTLILSFENVNFDDLIAWLEPLEQHYAITISEADVNVTDRENGLCNARITLQEK